MKVVPTIICLFFLSISVKGQVADTIKGVVLYKAYYTKDSVQQKKWKEDCRLEIGEKYTKFYSHTLYLMDTMFRNAVKRNETNRLPMLRNMVSSTNSSAETIYRNREGSIIHNFIGFVGDKFSFDDTTYLEWNISLDTATIIGFSCQKATTIFKGRQYEVWFSMSIPVSTGPWKLYGLPGMILKANDSKNLFGYEAYSVDFSIKGKVDFLTEKKEYLSISRQKFRELEALNDKDPLGYLRNVKGLNFTINGGDESVPKRPIPPKMELY